MGSLLGGGGGGTVVIPAPAPQTIYKYPDPRVDKKEFEAEDKGRGPNKETMKASAARQARLSSARGRDAMRVDLAFPVASGSGVSIRSRQGS